MKDLDPDSDHGSVRDNRGVPPDRLCAIAVMAKAPRLGQVKTRLIPPLTPEGAMSLNMCFLRDVTENICLAARTAPIQGFIAYAPAGTEKLFNGVLAAGTRFVLADGSLEMLPQVHGLGRSLLHAARALFAQGYQSVCLLNSDSPTLPTAMLRETVEALSTPGERIVLGPAEDGGYYLLGMKAAHVHLFEGIRWSTEHVAAETLERARKLGLEAVTLPPWYDVDDRASLQRLSRELSIASSASGGRLAPYPAPVTADFLSRIRLSPRTGQSDAAGPSVISADGESI